MPVVNSEVYFAFKEAGVSEETAVRVAKMIADRDRGFARLDAKMEAPFSSRDGRPDSRAKTLSTKIDMQVDVERRLDALERAMNGGFHELEMKMSVLKWQLSLTIAGVGALLLKTFLG